jgi:hypothetical protein
VPDLRLQAEGWHGRAYKHLIVRSAEPKKPTSQVMDLAGSARRGFVRSLGGLKPATDAAFRDAKLAADVAKRPTLRAQPADNVG